MSDLERFNRRKPFSYRDLPNRRPRYNDDSDYTTNAPSYYDDLARKTELMKRLAHRVWEYQELINKQFDEWDNQIREYFLEWQKNLDEFDDEVLRLLQEWMEDGTLDHIINDTIFKWKADKEYVDDEFKRIDNLISDELYKIDESLKTKMDKKLVPVNIKDFGALGDGLNDDSESLREALSFIESNGGGVLTIPEGEYLTDGVFDIPKNTTIQGYGDKSVFTRDDQSMIFRINGEITDTVSLIQNSELGDHYVYVSDTKPFKIGDYIRIISQREASSKEDSDEEYYLGQTTSSNHSVYFGEMRQISDISSNTGQLFFRGGLIFPDYRTNDVDETSEHARRNSTVERVEFKENVNFKDITFDGKFSNVIRYDLCLNCKADNIKWKNAHLGDFITFHNSLNCQGINSSAYYTPDVTPPNHYSRNAFKTVSSTNCGFDNVEVSHGTQNVDFTYTTSDSILTIPNIGSYLTNSRFYSPLFDGMTVHPGNIHPKISDNTFINCRMDGIFSRGRNATITDNLILSGITEEDTGSTVGIKVSQDASQNCLVSGNNIDGFVVGVRTHDNVNTEIGKLNLTISNNTITRSNRGVQLRRGTGSNFTGDSNIKIINNTITAFTRDSAKGIDIFDHYQKIIISGNTFEFNENVNGGIYTRGDSGDFIITNNLFSNYNSGFSILWFNDNTVSDISSTYLFKDNITQGTRLTDNNFNLANLSGNFVDRYYHNLMPYSDNELNMGSDSYRWRTGVFSNGVSQSSDINLKKDVKEIPKDFDILSQLKPKQYKLKDDDEKIHFGFIAQDIVKVIEDMGHDPNDYSFINKGENHYSLNYSELIPLLLMEIFKIKKDG